MTSLYINNLFNPRKMARKKTKFLWGQQGIRQKGKIKKE